MFFLSCCCSGRQLAQLEIAPRRKGAADVQLRTLVDDMIHGIAIRQKM